MLLPTTTRLLTLAVVLPCALAQLSNLIYTYQGQSAPASVLQAISSAGAPARAIDASQGTDTATALVGAFPTTATVLPVSAPAVTGTAEFSSGVPGEVLSTNTRPLFATTGTVNFTLPGPTGQTTTTKSGASALSFGVGLGLFSTVIGVVVGAGFSL